MHTIETDSYTLIIFDWEGFDPLNENVDVEVQLKTGERYLASLFTIENLRTLMKRHEASGECNDGKFFWCPDMVVVRELTHSMIREIVDYLIETDDLGRVFDGPVIEDEED